MANAAATATHSALVPKRKAVGLGLFGLVTRESYSANPAYCATNWQTA